MIFQIEQHERGDSVLSIYVAFDYAMSRGRGGRALNRLIKMLFPAFLHDVVWNHSLCQLKDVVESSSAPQAAESAPAPTDPAPALADQAGGGCMRWIE